MEGCIDLGRRLGYTHVGLQAGGECWAGDGAPTERAPETECNRRCNANGNETCGADWHNSVYATGD